MGECNNCGKRGHRAVDCLAKKGKEKDDDIKNLFVRATFYGEVKEENNGNIYHRMVRILRCVITNYI